MSLTIQEMYGRSLVSQYASRHGTTAGFPLPNWLVGIELEIENFSREYEQRFGGFTFTQDGSLRESERGVPIEAVSKPVQIELLPKLLEAFFKKFNITELNYSERCSTHVHFNVECLTPEQVSSVCLLYQTVERLLFNFIGNDRGNNIFCVPWNQCNLTFNVIPNLLADGHNTLRRWQKYSALNLIPVDTQGTLEFRHLEGTCDVERIMNWIGIISCLFKYALEHTDLEIQQEILNMNTVSNYHAWMEGLFGKYTKFLQNDGFDMELAQGVIDSKLMLVKPKRFNAADFLARTVIQPIPRPNPLAWITEDELERTANLNQDIEEERVDTGNDALARAMQNLRDARFVGQEIPPVAHAEAARLRTARQEGLARVTRRPRNTTGNVPF